MSRSCYDSQYKTCSMQIYRWLFFVSAISSRNLVEGLEPRDAVFVNFHRKYNVSKVAILHNGYLPPASIPDFSLPEVIDNRNVVGTNETRNYPNALYHPPDRDSLRAFTRNGLQDTRYLGSTGLLAPLQHHRRPTFLQGKHSRQTTTQSSPPPSSLPALGETPTSFANRINVEEMSCQNAGDELFFRKARNVPSMLNGGSKNALDVDVGLFRKTYNSENIFDTRIQSGGTVVLGEEILLRVLVNGDDGWRYSKIGQVTMHYMEERQQQQIVNSLWILDKDGCLNSDVREICPREQYKASPLESYLIFQAFMFDGMKETDEISLTVKAMACLEPADCVLDCPAGHVRRARNVPDRNNTVEWQDDIVLRVVLPKYESRAMQNYYLAILLLTMALLALIVLMRIIKTSLRRRITKS